MRVHNSHIFWLVNNVFELFPKRHCWIRHIRWNFHWGADKQGHPGKLHRHKFPWCLKLCCLTPFPDIYIYILTTVPPCQEHWAKHIQAAARNISLACEICNVEKTQKQQRQNPCKTRTNKIWDNCFDTSCNLKNELKSTSQCNTKELSSYSHPTV